MPEPDTQLDPKVINNGVAAGRKRKRSSERDEDGSAIAEDTVPVLRKPSKRKLRYGKDMKALEAARARLAEQYKAKTRKADTNEVSIE